MTGATTPLGRVLVVEDDRDMGALLVSSLTYDGFQCDLVSDLSRLWRRLDEHTYDALLLDLCLGTENAMSAIPEIVARARGSMVIVMTAHGSVDLAVAAMEKGATTFLTKSDDPSQITEQLKRRLGKERVAGQLTVEQAVRELGIVGESSALRQVFSQLERLQDVDATILVLGESGTGKEQIARALHLISSRAQAPFEAINCGAIPENLLESELFGTKKGAYTDAKADKEGLFEICRDGYVFLDEIGELPAHLQVKLLRVLQEREIKPLGATRSVRVQTRVIAATNRDLEKEVAEGRFREDLYYRLSVVPLTLPPLRDRSGDIPALVNHYLDRFNHRYGRQVQAPNADEMQSLMTYDWPGNIRELQNAVERAVLLSREGRLELDPLLMKAEERSDSSGGETVVYAEAKERFEKAFLQKILTVARGNISEAARISGRFRSDIYRLMDKYDMHQNQFK